MSFTLVNEGSSTSELDEILNAIITINQNQEVMNQAIQEQTQKTQRLMNQLIRLHNNFEQYKNENENLKNESKNNENENELNNKMNKLNESVKTLNELVLESKTVKNAKGEEVLASDEVLRKEVVELKYSVISMIDKVQKQNLTVNLDDEKVADYLSNRLESPAKQAISTSLERTAKAVGKYNQITKEQTKEIREQMIETKKDVKDLVFWLKPAVTGASIIMGMLLIALVTLTTGGQIVDNLTNWIGLRGAIINAYQQIFMTNGWGYLGWILLLILFVVLELAVLLGYGYGIYKLMKYAIDKLTRYKG